MPPVSATMAIRMRASERPGLLWALALRPFLGAATFSYSLSGRLAPGQRGGGHDMVSGIRAKTARARGARAVAPRAPGTWLLRVGLAVGLLRLFVRPSPRRRLGLGGSRRVVGRVLLAEVDGLVVGSGGSVVGGLVGLGEGGGVVRDDASSDFRSCSMPWTMRLYSSSLRTAPMEFFAKSSSTPGPASRRTVSSLTSLTVAYMPPIVRTPVPGCIWFAHVGGLLLLLLGRPGHQEHGPDEHDEREEGHETHGSELPSHDRDGERPDGWGYVRRRQGRHRRSLSESAVKEQRSAWHRGS